MKNKALYLAAAVSLAMSGCSLLRGFPGPGVPPTILECKLHGTCQIDLDVDNCVITPQYDEIHVKPGNFKAKIHWKLKSPHYSFRRDGVFIKQPTDQFTSIPTGNKSVFTLEDAKTQGGRFPYGIRIHDDRNNVDCKDFDPVIVNEM
jgi:hypothetical protein